MLIKTQIQKIMSAVLLMAVTVCFAHAQSVSGQNKKPYNLVNHTWLVEHSKERGKKTDCDWETCLNRLDYFKIVSEKPVPEAENRVILVIASINEETIYHFDTKVVSLAEAQSENNGYVNRFVGQFLDTASGKQPPPPRTICIDAVRYRDRYMDTRGDLSNSASGCLGRLKSFAAANLGDREIEALCGAQRNLVYWDIVDGKHETCSGNLSNGDQDQAIVVFDPEAGQGTGSGGNN